MAQILYLPHGGGPLPLLKDPGHQALTDFLTRIPERLATPEAILVISAHWEAPRVTITTAAQPDLLFDYYGFPEAAYQLRYPAPGEPALAAEILQRLKQAGIEADGDHQRGFDHGLFVPLLLMYPDANVPCVQLSLHQDLDPQAHLALGEALAPLRQRNLLVIGSGLSFHNMALLRQGGGGRGGDGGDGKHDADIADFHRWLIETCAGNLDHDQQRQRLLNWQQAPAARLCHPREEHLLPLHVCWGMAGGDNAAEVVFNDRILGHQAVGLLWSERSGHA